MGRVSSERSAGATLITPYRDGPLLVRGPVRIQDQEGQEIVIDREVVALCRCGKSRTRPLCDGTHKLVGFRAPSTLEQRAPTSLPRLEEMRGPALLAEHEGTGAPEDL
jgi:CDGSH-type Zn-finger protein